MTDVLEFLGYHIEADQLGGTEARRNSHIGRVPPPRIHDTPDPRMVVSRVEGEPPTIQEHLVPLDEIHGGWVGWNADVAEVARATGMFRMGLNPNRHPERQRDVPPFP